MNRFVVIADGKTLDTYDNISVSFNYQIEDILKNNLSLTKNKKSQLTLRLFLFAKVNLQNYHFLNINPKY